MKAIIVNVLFLLFCSVMAHAQYAIDNSTTETIRQIQAPVDDNVLDFQLLNRAVDNHLLAQQFGGLHKGGGNSQNDVGLTSGNQSYVVQAGNANELSIAQIGNGNLLYSYQLGYLSAQNELRHNPTVSEHKLFFTPGQTTVAGGHYEVVGERNQMDVLQNGDNNGVVAVQQGADNSISAEQTGHDNYLLALQIGTNNSIVDFKQANESERNLVDRITQMGDNNTLKTENASTTSLAGNSFVQTGANLTLEMNSDLANSAGGVEINQKGRDMKVVIDQSYFLFPMR